MKKSLFTITLILFALMTINKTRIYAQQQHKFDTIKFFQSDSSTNENHVSDSLVKVENLKRKIGKTSRFRSVDDSLSWLKLREAIGDVNLKWYTQEEIDSILKRGRHNNIPVHRVPDVQKQKQNERKSKPVEYQKKNRRTDNDTTSLKKMVPNEEMGSKDIRNDTATVIEPMIAVNPMDKENFISVYYSKINGTEKARASVTWNGGNTWSNRDIPSSLQYYKNQTDPVISFDADGNAYYSFLNSENTEIDSIAIVVVKSTDKGNSWFKNYIIENNGTDKTFFPDKEWITSDLSNSDFRNSIYVTWTLVTRDTVNLTYFYQVFFSYKRATEENFATPISLSTLFSGDVWVNGSYPIVASDGTIYVFWLKMNQTTKIGSIYMCSSNNGGQNFSGETEIVTGIKNVNGEVLNGNFFSAKSFPVAAIKKLDASNYEIYVVWSDKRSGTAALLFSKYNGSYWSFPMSVSSSFSEQYSPAVSINNNGVIDIAYFETTDLANGLIQLNVAEMKSDAISFNVFDNEPSFSGDATITGDYIGIASNEYSFLAVAPALATTSPPYSNDLWCYYRSVKPTIQNNIDVGTTRVYYNDYWHISPYTPPFDDEIAGTSKFIKAHNNYKIDNFYYTFLNWFDEDKNEIITYDSITYIPVEAHTYTARYFREVFVSVTVKNEFKEPTGHTSNGGIINVDYVDKNTDLIGGKFDTTYSENSTHRFEANDQFYGNYYRGFNYLSNYNGGWRFSDTIIYPTQYTQAIAPQVKQGTYTAKYRNRYNVNITSPQYIEQNGSGCVYRINDGDEVTSFNSSVWQYEQTSIKVEAISYNPDWVFIGWSDGELSNTKYFTVLNDNVNNLYAVFKKHFSSISSIALGPNEQHKIAYDNDNGKSIVVYESGGTIVHAVKFNNNWSNEAAIELSTPNSFATHPSVEFNGARCLYTWQRITNNNIHTIIAMDGFPPTDVRYEIDQFEAQPDFESNPVASFGTYANNPSKNQGKNDKIPRASSAIIVWRTPSNLSFKIFELTEGMHLQCSGEIPGTTTDSKNVSVVAEYRDEEDIEVHFYNIHLVWDDKNEIYYLSGKYDWNDPSVIDWNEPISLTKKYPEITHAASPVIVIEPRINRSFIYPSTPHIFWHGMFGDDPTKNRKGDHWGNKIYYISRVPNSDDWTKLTEFFHIGNYEPHDHFYPSASIEEGDHYSENVLRCAWQCGNHITYTCYYYDGYGWIPPTDLGENYLDVSFPNLLGLENKSLAVWAQQNEQGYSITPFLFEGFEKKFLSERRSKTGNIEHRRGSVDLSNIELSGDKEFDLNGAIWLITNSYKHKSNNGNDLILFTQEQNPSKLQDWLGTESFIVGYNDTLIVNNEFTLSGFSASEVDSVLTVPILTVNLIDAYTKEKLIELDKLTLGNIVGWNAIDTVIPCNHTVLLNGLAGRKVKVQVRLIGQREHLREPAWTEIIQSDNSENKLSTLSKQYIQQIRIIPSKYELEQNYPNPFNPTTSISYSLPKESYVTLKVYNIIGNEVATLVNEHKNSGNYVVIFDATHVPSGIYVYKFTAGAFVDMKKMLLMK